MKKKLSTSRSLIVQKIAWMAGGVFFGLLFLHVSASAQTLSSSQFELLNPGVSGSGGKMTSASFQVQGAVGEIAVGQGSSASFQVDSGILGFAAVASSGSSDSSPTNTSIVSGGATMDTFPWFLDTPGVAITTPPVACKAHDPPCPNLSMPATQSKPSVAPIARIQPSALETAAIGVRPETEGQETGLEMRPQETVKSRPQVWARSVQGVAKQVLTESKAVVAKIRSETEKHIRKIGNMIYHKALEWYNFIFGWIAGPIKADHASVHASTKRFVIPKLGKQNPIRLFSENTQKNAYAAPFINAIKKMRIILPQ